MITVVLRKGGRGAPVVTFLHGLLGAPGQATALVEALPEGIGVDAVVLPGHGLEPWMPEGSFSEIAAEIARSLPEEQNRLLLGYSLGGRLALAMGLVEPARFRSIVTVGAHLGFADPSERSERVRSDRAKAVELRADGLQRFVDAWEKQPIFATQTALDRARLGDQRAMRLGHTALGIAWSLERLGTGEMPLLDVARSEVHVTLVAGGLDEKFAAIARAAAWGSLAVDAAIVPGVGHNVLLEAPAALAAIVAARCPWAAARSPLANETCAAPKGAREVMKEGNER